MMAHPWVSGGVIGYDLRTIRHSFDNQRQFAEFQIPAGSKCVYQNMGKKSTSIPVTGFTFDHNQMRQMLDWEASGTVLCYSGTKVYLSGCIIQDLSYTEEANPGTYPYQFSFKFTEV